MWNKILISGIILILIGSCQKENVDYRNKYYGDWTFKTEVYDMTYGSDLIEAETTFMQEAFISFDSLNIINIQLEGEEGLKTYLDLDGKLTDAIPYNRTNISGEFISNDSLFLMITYFKYYPTITHHVLFGKKNN